MKHPTSPLAQALLDRLEAFCDGTQPSQTREQLAHELETTVDMVQLAELELNAFGIAGSVVEIAAAGTRIRWWVASRDGFTPWAGPVYEPITNHTNH